MSIIYLPADMLFGGGCGMGQRNYDMLSASEVTGSSQSRTFAPARWVLKLVSPAKLNYLESAAWERVALQLRGKANHLAAHDPGRPVPYGTRRGSLALGAGCVAGATVINVTGSGSLLTGDYLQIGSGLGTSQLVKVMATTTGPSVEIAPPIRIAFATGTPVTWDKPMAYFKQVGESASWSYATGLQSGFAIDLLEDWSA